MFIVKVFIGHILLFFKCLQINMQKTTYTTDWFTINIPNWETLLERFKGKPQLRYLEVGCFQGRSLVWMLENILTHETSTADAVDSWAGSPEHSDEQKKDLFMIFLNNVSSYPVDKINIHRGYSYSILRRDFSVGYDMFDIIYIDADHKASSVLEDAILAFRLLKPGGVMIFDDYQIENTDHDINFPKIAIDAFCHIFRDEIENMYISYQVAIIKK